MKLDHLGWPALREIKDNRVKQEKMDRLGPKVVKDLQVYLEQMGQKGTEESPALQVQLGGMA